MTAELKAWLIAGATVVAAILVSIAAWCGYRFGVSTEHARGNAQIATLRQTYANENAQGQAALRKRLEEATARGDELSAKLLQASSATTTQSQEKSRVIQSITTGRRCLDAGVVRVLNSEAASDSNHNGRNVPEATGSIVAEDGAAATDTDVALWANNARSQYDICRSRLDALIDYEVHP